MDPCSPLYNEIANLNTQLQALQRDMMNMTYALREQTVRLGVLENRLVAIPGLPPQAERQMNVNERDQEQLVDSVEIAGFPENFGETAAMIATTLSNNLGLEVKPEDIIQFGRLDVNLGGIANQNPPPRLLYVRFGCCNLRDEILRRARHERDLEVDIPGVGVAVGPLFINEHLTTTTRELFCRAREQARLNHWRYVWIRGGKIFARRNDGSKIIRIRTEANLFEIQN